MIAISAELEDAEPRLFSSYGVRNTSAAKVVGTALVVMLADVLQDYEVALVSVEEGRESGRPDA